MKVLTVSACTLASALCGCTPAPRTTDPAQSTLRDLAVRHEAVVEIDGRCDVHLRNRKVRTRAHMLIDSERVNVALVDEFGIPLVEVISDSDGVGVSRSFPPLTRETATGTGIAFRAFGLVFVREFGREKTAIAHVTPRISGRIHASDGYPDSLIVLEGDTRLRRLVFHAGGFVALHGAMDTLCVFRSHADW